MLPAEWTAALAPNVEWRAAYATVAREARFFLTHSPLAADVPLSTTELVEHLFPEKLARGAGIEARKRIFKGLAALATHDLADCASRGAEQRKMGKVSRPWLWHPPAERNPEAVETKHCPHCGGAL